MMIVLCGLMAVGCENFDPEATETKEEVNEVFIYAAGDENVAGDENTRAYIGTVGASTGAASKIVWDAGDKVGVYLTGTAPEANVCFTSQSGKGAKSATFRGEFVNKRTTGNFTWYAYSPYNATAGTAYNAIAGYLSPTQVQTDAEGTHIGDHLFEIAKPVTATSNKGGVNMTFTSKFAVLNFKVKLGTGEYDGQYSGAKVHGVRIFIADPSDTKNFTPLHDNAYKLGGSFVADLTGSSVSFSNDSYAWIVDLQTENNPEVTATTMDGAVDCWAVVNPIADLTGKKLVAEVATDKGVFVTSRTMPSGKLEANKVYVISTTIKHPPVSLQAFPLWTEGNNFFSVCEYNENETKNLGSATELKPANCFMVKPNTLYKFKANVRGRGAEGVAAMGITSGSKVVGDYVINSNGTISGLMDEHDYIYFKTTTTGNGVISLYNGGTVLWSWHVWSMNETPDAVSIGNGVQMLDRNLGVVTEVTSSTSSITVANYGLYYSWGFNVPVPGIYRVTSINGVVAGVYSNKLNNIYYYNASMTPTAQEDRIIIPSGSLATATMQPQAPAYLAANDDEDASTDPYLNMWGFQGDGSVDENNYEKTAFDPCPYGYRVSSYYDYKAATSVSSSQVKNTMIDNLCLGGTAYMLRQGIVGCLSNEDGNIDAWRLQEVSFAYMWTATPAQPAKATNEDPPVSGNYALPETNGRAMSRVIWDSKTTNYAMRRYQGAPVRCVKYAAEN